MVCLLVQIMLFGEGTWWFVCWFRSCCLVREHGCIFPGYDHVVIEGYIEVCLLV